MTTTMRVVLVCGARRDVVVVERLLDNMFIASCGARSSRSRPALSVRGAVASLVWLSDWPVAEIVAPGELTRVETVMAERERCAAVCDAAAARWGVLAPGELTRADDRRERGNEASALAAEIRGGAR